MAITKSSDKIYVIDNAVFAYCKLAEPSKRYQSEDTEYSVDVIVDKETFKQWNKLFPKQKGKELEVDEFKQKYKMDAPFEGDEVYTLKLKKAATKDGVAFDEKYRPKVLLGTAEGNVDITTSRLVSNGSRGKVSVFVTQNSFGTFGKLNAIWMDEAGFIEYKSNAGGTGSEFGGIVKAEPTNQAAIADRKAAEARKESAKPAPQENEEFEDETSQF